MGLFSSSKSSTSLTQTDNRIGVQDGRAFQIQGGVNFSGASGGQSFTDYLNSLSAPPVSQYDKSRAYADYLGSKSGGSASTGSTQAVVYTEEGGISLTGSNNRLVVSDFGAIQQARSITESALDLVRETTAGFTSSLKSAFGEQTSLAESAATGGASTTQKNFIWLALAAFALIAWVNRK